MTMLVYSHSHLSMYEECPLKYNEEYVMNLKVLKERLGVAER